MPDLLAALDPEQRQAVDAVRGPVCILAGAGTGKTRTITHRIAHQVSSGAASPDAILAVTFTARAAGELRTRLRALGADGVQARTFHAAALRQLTYFWPRISRAARPQLVESKLPAIRAAAASLRLSVSPAEQRDLAAEVEWAKAAQVTAEDYAARAQAAGRVPPMALHVVGRVYAGYERVNSERGQIDFEDLLLLMAGAVESDEDIAREVRSRYRHFTVDEYQDVSPLQQRLLDAWLGDRDELCVVGDPRQTIYTFTGATPTYLTSFTRRFPEAAVVTLVRDYRSGPQVVALANALMPDARLVAHGPGGPEPSITKYDDEPSEAAAVAARIVALRDAGVPLREMAVLFRVNAQSEVYEQALTTLGVAYVLRGGERFFDRPEVREAVVLLRGATRAANDETRPLLEVVGEVLAVAGLSAEPPAAAGAARERWESLRALHGLAEEMVAASPDATLPDFVTELSRRAEAQHAPAVEGVTLASLHAAKGLEWDAVFLVGLVDGTLPITHATTPAAVEEEKRLLYVGITRARQHLALSWADFRAAGGRRPRPPSRFLAALRPAQFRPAVGTGGVPGRKPKKAAVEAPAEDEKLFIRLREWRRERSTADGVPAYVVFDNKTLVALAAARPRSRAELVLVPGVGPAKVERYADEVLAIVADVG